MSYKARPSPSVAWTYCTCNRVMELSLLDLICTPVHSGHTLHKRRKRIVCAEGAVVRRDKSLQPILPEHSCTSSHGIAKSSEVF